jgi:serralysin
MSSNLFSIPSQAALDTSLTNARSCTIESALTTTNTSDRTVTASSNQLVTTNSTFDFVFVGGASNDSYSAGVGDTLFDGQSGIDVVDYSRMTQGITLDTRGSVYKGQAGTDRLVSIERILGPAGLNNWIDGSTSSGTSMNVNLSTNSLSVNSSSLVVNFEVQNFGNVIGSSESDVIIGNSNSNTLIGGAGNDIIRGGGGFDRLTGGTGSDHFVLGDANQLDGLGQGQVTITDWNAAADYIVTGGNPNAYSLSFINVSGGFGLDTIISFGNDVVAVIEDNTDVNIDRDFRFVTPGVNRNLVGTGSDDRLVGRFGNTLINGGFGLDTADYANLDQGISMDTRGFVNKGIAGIDQLMSVERVIAPTGYANLIDGSTAGAGTSINVDLSRNSMTTTISPNFAINLTIQNFVDVIGTSQNDVIYGNAQNNTLSGGAGSDFLRGNGGFDRLTGGGGTDYFVLGDANRLDGLGNNLSTITDWNAAEDFIVTGGNLSSYSLNFINVSGGSALDTVIYYGNDAIAVIEDSTNVSVSRDFKFV